MTKPEGVVLNAIATPIPAPHLRVHRFRVLLSLAAVYVIWGSSYFATHIGLTGFPPFLMAGTRFSIAGVILYCWLRMRGVPSPSRSQWLASFGIALLLVVATNGGVVYAQQWVDSSFAAIAFATTPLWAALFAGIFERWPSKLEWVGLTLGFAGILLLNGHVSVQAHPLAAAALLGSAASWSLGSIIGRHVHLPPGLMAAASQMVTGGPMMIAIALLRGERLTHMPNQHAILATAYLAIFSSLIAFSAFTYLIHNTRPALATSHSYVNPVVALFLGVVFLNESVDRLEVVAIGVTLLSVIFIMQGKGSDRPHPMHATTSSHQIE
jgi:drug/metabolite transporter (DMT)-like permease